MVLLEGEQAYTRSTAALRIARGLGFPWAIFYIKIIVPRPIRDWMYDVVARHRYQWFGRRNECRVPTPELRARFME
jgi:predicted DCC family thiol-disulfide oxidoreductase YuxK